MKSRGEEPGTQILISNEIKLDSSEPLTANYYWENIFPLFDALTGKLILPNDKGLYSVYLIDDKNNINQVNLTATELEKLHAYKFNSQKNAAAFLKR